VQEKNLEFPNIRHLLAFREVALAQGISAAAHKVHRSQPAMTQAIAGLERQLDTALFDRQAGGMFLTPAGDLFFARVCRMFDHLAQGAREAVQMEMRQRLRQKERQKHQRPSPGFYLNTTAAQLRALVAIGQAGSFSVAARQTGLSQPSIHRAGRDLERLAAMPFYTTTGKGVELTRPGAAFTRAVRLAKAELQQGLDELGQLKGEDSTRITVGSLPLSRSTILPQAIHDILQEKANVQLRNVDGPYPELLRALRHGDLDFLIGALRDPVAADDVVQEPLFSDLLTVVAGPGHPLAERAGLTLKDTLAYPWIAPPRETPTGDYLYRQLGIGQMDNTPVRIVSSSLIMMRGLLARGKYLTILSQHQATLEISLGQIVPLAVTLPDSARPIGLTYRAGWLPTATQTRFLDLIRAAANRPGYTQNE